MRITVHIFVLCPVQNVLIVDDSLGTLLTMNGPEKHPQIKGMLLLNPPLKPRLHPKMIPASVRFAFGKVHYNNPAEAALHNDLGSSLRLGCISISAGYPGFGSFWLCSGNAARLRQLIAKMIA